MNAGKRYATGVVTSTLATALVTVLAAALAAALVTRPVSAQQRPKPRLEPARVAGELVLGSYAGIGGFVIGRFVGYGVSDLVGVENETARRRVAFVGGVVGGGLATAGMVYAIGNAGDQAGDFDATLLGTGVGFIAAAGIAKLILGPALRPRPGSSTAKRWATANRDPVDQWGRGRATLLASRCTRLFPCLPWSTRSFMGSIGLNTPSCARI